MQIGQYHQVLPEWRQTANDKPGQLIGVELEVHHPRSRQTAADVLDTLDFGQYPVPFAERDGSISQEHGVEIICPPLPLEEAVSPTGYIARLMQGLAAKGTTAVPAANYGMHVNINLDGWTAQEKLLVQFLINKFGEAGQIIGNRDGKGCGGFHPTLLYKLEAGGRLQLHTFFGDKHCAAWIRPAGRNRAAGGGEGRVMEVRFPRSTLDIERLKLVVDYVFALKRWVQTAPNHTEAACFLAQLHAGAGVALYGQFVNWCAKYKPTVATALRPELTYTKPDKTRLEDAMSAVAEREAAINLKRVGLTNEGNAGSKEQALRISALIGKGAKLQGQRSIEDYEVRASSVRNAA